MRRIICLAAFLIASSPAAAGDFGTTLDLAAGTAQALSSGSSNNASGGNGVERARARAGLNYSGDGGAEVESAVELAGFRSKDAARFLPAKLPLRLENETNRAAYEGDYAWSGNLDRLNVRFASETSVFTVGRQSIGHGSGKFFNPSDIFAPVNPSTAWTEYKSGIDAARFTKRLGELDEAELYVVAHREGADRAYYLARARTGALGGDLSAYWGWTLGAPTLAFDFSSDLGGANLNLEAIARLDEDPSKNARAALGASGRLLDSLDLFAEYHVNGPGELQKKNYGRATRSREMANGEIFLVAVHYAALGAEFTVNPLLTAGCSWLVNLDDRSTLVHPTLEFWATENVTLTAGASLSTGRGKQSEFGPQPDLVYLEIKYYR